MNMRRLFFFIPIVIMAGCVSKPEGIEPVSGFELNRYLGTWYEIARLDHRFERGLERVTADYSLRDDGTVKVVNRGFNTSKNEWEEAVGQAKFVEDQSTGFLKVSFFGPFYGSYIIFDLDQEDYQYSYVAGPDRSYLWLLARTPEVEESRLEHFISTAQQLGFPTDELILVDHQ